MTFLPVCTRSLAKIDGDLSCRFMILAIDQRHEPCVIKNRESMSISPA